jgi:hypothetical protein
VVKQELDKDIQSETHTDPSVDPAGGCGVWMIYQDIWMIEDSEFDLVSNLMIDVGSRGISSTQLFLVSGMQGLHDRHEIRVVFLDSTLCD